MQISKTLTNSEPDWAKIQQKYHTALQTRALCADTKNLFGEAGRGSGKTTYIFAPRILRVSYDMPRSIIMLVGPTYTFLLETIVPEIITYLNTYYQRGIYFEYGKRPPEHFKRPYTEVAKWEHTISFAWGTVIQFASMDRPESFVGKNIVHLVVDELLRIRENDFRERAVPTLRADRSLFGGSHYFKGMTGFSSTPNMDNDHDWWMDYSKNVNEKPINELMFVAYKVLQAGGKVVQLRQEIDELRKQKKGLTIARKEQEVDKINRFISKWEAKLNVKRNEKQNWWYYMKATSFSNLAVLGLDYMEQQLMASGENYEKFNLSILCLRPKTIKDPFFPHFGARHIFEDEYKYEYGFGDRGSSIDNFSIENFGKGGGLFKNSIDLKYCNPDAALLMGYDPGSFQSAVIAQKNRSGRTEELRFLKDFFCWVPDEHAELADKITKFFKHHRHKVIYLIPDRAGHKRIARFRENPKGKTDVSLLKFELEARGWTVHVEGIKRTIEHWEHYMLWAKLLKENTEGAPKLRFSCMECESLISSIRTTKKLPDSDNWIEMDKTAERKLSFSDQVMNSPQIASAATYLIFWLYEKLKPEADPDTVDFASL